MAAFVSAVVVPRRYYKHTTTGRAVSIFGAHPDPSRPDDWHVVTRGYAIKATDRAGVTTYRGPNVPNWHLETVDDAVTFARRLSDTVSVAA